MAQTATPQPAESTSPPAPAAGQPQTPAPLVQPQTAQPQTVQAKPLVLPGAVNPMDAGIAFAAAGLLGFLLCRLVLTRHWIKIKADPDAHPLGAIWTDVLVRLFSYVCVLMLGIGLLLIGARLAGRI